MGYPGLLESILGRAWLAVVLLATGATGAALWRLPAHAASHGLRASSVGIGSPMWIAVGLVGLAVAIIGASMRRATSRRRMNEYLAHDRESSRQAQINKMTARPTRLSNASDVASFIDFSADRAGKPNTWSLELIQRIEWKRFDDLCAAFYRERNIRCATTPLGLNGGVDIRLLQGERGETTCIVRCKAWGQGLIGPKPLRDLFVPMTYEKIPKAFFVTSGGFTDEARNFARASRMTLIDGPQFLEMIERLPEPSRKRLLRLATAGDYTRPSCPVCAIKMVEREGEQGKFWGCVAFPRCYQSLPMYAH